MRPPLLVAAFVPALAIVGCSFPDYTVTTPPDDTTTPPDDGGADTFTDSTTSDGALDADVAESTVDGDASSDGETDSEAGSECAPVVQKNFPLTTAYKLTCASSTVLDVTLPAGI